MANVIKKGGLRLKSASVDQELMVCLHDSGDSNPLGIGDAVMTNSAGAATLAGGPYTKSVKLIASATTPIFGVVEGVLKEAVATGMNLDTRYAPASTEMYVLVRRANRKDLYAITEDSAGGSLSVANIGYGANLTGNGGGTTITTCDTVTGQSTLMLDSSSADASTATLQLRTEAYEDTLDNTPGTTNSSIIVSINNCEEAGGTGTVGV